MRKKFTVIIVRHGQGLHNLNTHDKKDLERTDDIKLKTLNTMLTEKGVIQANLVAQRLKDVHFDLAISSDLKRAVKTGEAILSINESIDEILQWKIARERCFGDFEGLPEVLNALRTVEEAVSDRDYLTWRPPNGESVVDLRNRILEFLQLVQKEAMKLPSISPTILVASHGAFMEELYYILANSRYGQTIPNHLWSRGKPGYQNTGVAKYTFSTNLIENDTNILEEVECHIFSCASHLANHDENYIFCKGGCHGDMSHITLSRIDERP